MPSSFTEFLVCSMKPTSGTASTTERASQGIRAILSSGRKSIKTKDIRARFDIYNFSSADDEDASLTLLFPFICASFVVCPISILSFEMKERGAVIHRLLQRFVRGRSLCVVLGCALVISSLSMCLVVPSQSAFAESAVLSVGYKIEYDNWDTNVFSVNGFEAYCGTPSSTTPPEGTYEMEPLFNTVVAAGLWYGYGGPGFDASLWPQDGPAGSSADGYRVMTHLALAYLATGSPSFAYGENASNSFKSWCESTLFGAGSICDRIRNEGFMVNGASTSATALPQGFSAYSMQTGSDTQVIYAMDYHPRGHFTLQKSSARPSISNDNGNYTLAGAKYGVYGDAGCTRAVGTITTDSKGSGSSPELEVGTYYIKEIAPPTGYALNSTATRITVNAGDNGTVSVKDEPQSDPVDILLRKVDVETGEASPLGGASLTDAEYTVRFYAGQFPNAEEAAASSTLRRTWVIRTDAAGELHLSDDAKVSGDDFYLDAQGRIVLPLGTVTLEETTPPTGYLIDESILVAHITSSGTDASVDTYREQTHPEQVIRGDLSFKKARETDQHRLPSIPFRLTSNTTGESHILVTDENGEVKTSNEWNIHTASTNENDAALAEDGTVDEDLLSADAGIWFGTDEPRDELGALPFDTYTLSELRVSANEGLELITIPLLVIRRNAYQVDWGTLDDQPTPQAILSTHASDAFDGDKTVDAQEEANIVDQVRYAGVTPGREYRIAGRLVERETEAVIMNRDNEPVGNERTFIADSGIGELELSFSFDASAYAESDVVVLEELTDMETDQVIAAESNLDDVEQTVHIVASKLESPPLEEPEEEGPLVLIEELPEEPTPRIETGLAVTGDTLLPLMFGCTAGGGVAAITTFRMRRTKRRRRLRAALRPQA